MWSVRVTSESEPGQASFWIFPVGSFDLPCLTKRPVFLIAVFSLQIGQIARFMESSYTKSLIAEGLSVVVYERNIWSLEWATE